MARNRLVSKRDASALGVFARLDSSLDGLGKKETSVTLANGVTLAAKNRPEAGKPIPVAILDAFDSANIIRGTLKGDTPNGGKFRISQEGSGQQGAEEIRYDWGMQVEEAETETASANGNGKPVHIA